MSQHLLRTDAYKLSMAQAGFPLREECFYLAFRRGGWQLVPFDLRAAVEALRPEVPADDDPAWAFAAAAGYAFDDAMRAALRAPLEIDAVPAGSWVGPREPILTVRGPSFLVSWLEPLLLRLHHPIQAATQLVRGTWKPAMGRVVGEEHATLLASVADAVGVALPPIEDESSAYGAAVARHARELIEVVDDPARLFEVGMRAAVTEEQHRMALQALRALGIVQTSNVALAMELGMHAVGTMGHEHVQRWGSDLDAFRAMRDMRVGAPSYLLDTFDTIGSGIPAARQVMEERAHACSVRYDSGDKRAQYLLAHGAFERAGVAPVHILEDGFDRDATAEFELLRTLTKLPPERQRYGYGGHLVARTATNPLTRDRVAAVYKLTESAGEARMKLGDAAGIGKRSVPGRPVVWRRLRGDGPLGVIAQAGETPPDDYVLLTGNPDARERIALAHSEADLAEGDPATNGYHRSPATRALERRLATVPEHTKGGR